MAFRVAQDRDAFKVNNCRSNASGCEAPAEECAQDQTNEWQWKKEVADASLLSQLVM